MKYSESLKKNRDFQNVYKKGKSYANRYLVMYVLENDTDRNRLGISVFPVPEPAPVERQSAQASSATVNMNN